MAKSRSNFAPTSSPTSSPAPLPPAIDSGAPDPVPASIREFVEFFAREFEGISFPVQDSRTLDAASLRALIEELRNAARAEELAQAELASARLELGRVSAALQGATKRAHAYAKVFASERPELLDALAEIRLVERKLAPRKTRVRKRGKGSADESIETGQDRSQLKLAGSAPEPSAA